jgi:beta-1,4-mannooligosaccharide/beta-1,4-mannosyl-N-acetylglucosamine phosphorylase
MPTYKEFAVPKMFPELRSHPVIRRWNRGEPVLSKKDVPYEAECIFNAGVAKYQGRYVMIFRNDYGYNPERGNFAHCNLGIAFSRDGISWEVEKKPFFSAERLGDPEVTRVYDPRLTVIGGKCYLCFAMDTEHGTRGGIARTEDFEGMDILSLSVPDNRNMVLFPEKTGGLYWRLERPFPVYSRGGIDRFDTWISASPDLRYWGDSSLTLRVEQVPWANDKTGPGAPPVRTDKGWLVLFHAVDRDRSRGKNGWWKTWQKRYCAGAALLDLENPSRLIGLCREPILAPETPWECDEGYRTNVIFPGGLILEESGELKIYYGAADTVECLATADVHELTALCAP